MLTSLLFVVTEEFDAQKKKKKLKSEKSPGCNFGKGCGNNLKLIGAGRKSFFCLQTCGAMGDERNFYN